MILKSSSPRWDKFHKLACTKWKDLTKPEKIFFLKYILIVTFMTIVVSFFISLFIMPITCCGSMEPAFETDDFLVSIPIFNEDEIKVGDIVSIKNSHFGDYFSLPTWFMGGIVHRVIWMNDTHVITKGDANLKQDPIMQKEWVYDKVVGIIEKETMILVCSGLIIILILYEFDSDRLNPKKKPKKKRMFFMT